MSAFFDLSKRQKKDAFENVQIQTVYGDHVMLSYVHLEPNGIVPLHSHPHEQMGLLLEGECEFTIGDETRTVKVGDVWWIPGDVEHTVKNGDKYTLALDIFYPIREDLK